MTAGTTHATGSHPDDALLGGWAHDALPQVAAWTVESHLETCAACRTRLDDVATPTMTLAWLAAVGLVTAGMLVLGAQLDQVGATWDGVGLFLAVAPAVPLLGVAISYGAHTDPTHDLLRAAPMSAAHLLVIRSAAVVATTVVPMVIVAILAPQVGVPALAAVLPSVAVVVAMALATSRSATIALAMALLGRGAGRHRSGGPRTPTRRAEPCTAGRMRGLQSRRDRPPAPAS